MYLEILKQTLFGSISAVSSYAVLTIFKSIAAHPTPWILSTWGWGAWVFAVLIAIYVWAKLAKEYD